MTYIFAHYVMKISGVSSLGVPGVPWHPQILADRLSLSQPRGTDYVHLITTGTPGFSNLPTALNLTVKEYKNCAATIADDMSSYFSLYKLDLIFIVCKIPVSQTSKTSLKMMKIIHMERFAWELHNIIQAPHYPSKME